MVRKIPLKFKKPDGTIITLPDDYAQLCGYDIAGDEIYEGDNLGGVWKVCEASPDKIAVETYDTDDDCASITSGSRYHIPEPIFRGTDGGDLRCFIKKDGKKLEERFYLYRTEKGDVRRQYYFYVEGDN